MRSGLVSLNIGLILAQAGSGPDASAVASGWVGAGLLGLVLSWIFFKHLPAKDDQIERLIKSKDVAIKEMIEFKDKQIETNQEICKEEQKQAHQSHERQMEMLANTLQKQLDALGKSVMSLGEIIQHVYRNMGNKTEDKK